MNRTLKISICSFSLAAMSAGIVFAQGPGDRPPHGPPHGPPGGGGGEQFMDDGPPPAPPLDKALDSDKDGNISAKEQEQAVASLQTLDVNKDGKLTEDELKPQPPAGEDDKEERKSKRRPVPPLMKALDTDANGELSEDEIATAQESLKQLDHNNDGKLSRMEIRPSRRFKPEKKD